MNARLDLDDYQILGTLGVGTVGTIFAALDTVNERRVAIKELHPNVSRDELIRSRFKREMTILSRLQHPNIIRYHGSGDAGGKLFYVMELVEGGSVKELIHSSDQLAWPMVVSISRQICSALQFAHNHGIIHRDLKPANLFLSRSGVVKLGDFGIARDTAAADLTASGLTVGTHAYMAPEQITADGTISGKADLYALGCCMFEMLTGHQPFRGANFAQLFEQHLNATPPSVRDVFHEVPEELDAVIRQCLAKQPDDRPFNARAVQGVMFQIQEKYKLDPDNATTRGTDHGTENDVGASEARQVDRGTRMLQRQIAARLGDSARRDVSWKSLLLLVLVIVAGITAFLVVRFAGFFGP